MRRAGALLAALAVAAVACGGTAEGTDGGTVELTVSAASSLTAAFTDIGHDFEAEHPGVTVVFNFGPSDGLAAQIEDGGGVDVFASASPTWMDAVEADPGVTRRMDFARNRLAILVPSDDPAGIATLEDLAEPGVELVLAAEGVPAGDYARAVLANAGIAREALANVVSNEVDVKGVLTKIVSGEGDAGIGYVTDVTPDLADEVRLIEIPDDVNVVAVYPIAVVVGTEHPQDARAFVDHVIGPGQDVLDGYGFLPAA